MKINNIYHEIIPESFLQDRSEAIKATQLVKRAENIYDQLLNTPIVVSPFYQAANYFFTGTRASADEISDAITRTLMGLLQNKNLTQENRQQTLIAFIYRLGDKSISQDIVNDLLGKARKQQQTNATEPIPQQPDTEEDAAQPAQQPQAQQQQPAQPAQQPQAQQQQPAQQPQAQQQQPAQQPQAQQQQQPAATTAAQPKAQQPAPQIALPKEGIIDFKNTYVQLLDDKVDSYMRDTSIIDDQLAVLKLLPGFKPTRFLTKKGKINSDGRVALFNIAKTIHRSGLLGGGQGKAPTLLEIPEINLLVPANNANFSNTMTDMVGMYKYRSQNNNYSSRELYATLRAIIELLVKSGRLKFLRAGGSRTVRENISLEESISDYIRSIKDPEYQKYLAIESYKDIKKQYEEAIRLRALAEKIIDAYIKRAADEVFRQLNIPFKEYTERLYNYNRSQKFKDRDERSKALAARYEAPATRSHYAEPREKPYQEAEEEGREKDREIYSKDPENAFKFAMQLRDLYEEPVRWEYGEKALSGDAKHALAYAQKIMTHKWVGRYKQKAEDTISNSGDERIIKAYASLPDYINQS